MAQVHAPSDATIQTHVADLKRALVNRRIRECRIKLDATFPDAATA